MSTYKISTAVFDVFVDDDLRATFEAPSRGEANRMACDKVPESRWLSYQGRVHIEVREHEHSPAAGDISVCVFCQQRLT